MITYCVKGGNNLIKLITYLEKDFFGNLEIKVSHGINLKTNKKVLLPAKPLMEVGYFNVELECWILKEDK